MKRLITNYLGEWVYATENDERWVLSFDGWLAETSINDLPRFFRAANTIDIEFLAQAYVRFYYKHSLKPKQALSLFTSNINQLPKWGRVLEDAFIDLYSIALEKNPHVDTPDWLNYISVEKPDIYSHKFLKSLISQGLINNIILEESGISEDLSLTGKSKTYNSNPLKKQGGFKLNGKNETKDSPKSRVFIQWVETWDEQWFDAIKNKTAIIITFNDEVIDSFKKLMTIDYRALRLNSKYAYPLTVFFIKPQQYINKESTLGQFILTNHNKAFNGDYLLRSWMRKSQPLNSIEFHQGKAIYYPKSKKDKGDSSIPPDLFLPVQKALNNFELSKGSIDNYVQDLIGEAAYNNLAPEQIDAVGLTLKAFEDRLGFILADVTGKGKGRTLAATILAALGQGHNVVFMTEKINLFSDLYRDFKNIANIPEMYLFHKDAKIIDENGKLVQKASIKKDFYTEKQSFILTTYSQFNRIQKFNSKLEWLKEHLQGKMGKGILILDEAHTAAGQSNIAKNIDQLITVSNGVLYSSATYVKTEKNLAIYRKAIPVNKDFFEIIQKTLNNQNFNELRQVITLAMAEQGQFIRREHLIDKRPVKKDVELNAEQEQTVKLFSDVWCHIFELFKLRKEYLQVNGLDKGKDAINHWYKLGNTVNRTSMELSLFFKMDVIKQSVESLLPEIKPVIVMETTMEATLKRLLEYSNEDNWDDLDDADTDTPIKKPKMKFPFVCKKDNQPLWKYKLVHLARQVADENMLASADNETKKVLFEHMDAISYNVEKMPDWSASPIDTLKDMLSQYNCDELSGRSIALDKIKSGYRAVERKPAARNKIVHDFNNGKTDVLIITRTGSTGISLHAGSTFKDQRPRQLIEAEIPRDPVQRIQFWGRVSRKDEVVESNIESIVLNMPLDIRNWENQNEKQDKAMSHLGALQGAQKTQYISTYGNAIAYEWLQKNKFLMSNLGLMATKFNLNNTDIINKLLSRSILIGKDKQKELVNFLDQGLLLAQHYESASHFDASQPSEARSSLFLYGMPRKKTNETNTKKQNYSLDNLNVYLTQRVFNIKAQSIKTEQVIGDIKAIEWPEKEIEQLKDIIIGKNKTEEWLLKILPVLRKGLILKIKRPWDNQYTKAVLGNVIFPENKRDYGITTAGLQLWLPAMSKPLIISFWLLFNQNAKILCREVLNKKWFEASGQTDSLVYYTLEGNPFLSALWAIKRGQGYSVNVKDTITGFENVVLLPRHMTAQQIWKEPIDLIKVEQAYSFIKTHKEGVLYESTYGNSMYCYWFNNQLMLSVTHNFQKNVFDEILPFPVKRKLGYPQYIQNRIAYKIQENDFMFILHSLDNVGISWSIDSNFRAWYEKKGLYC